MPEKVRKQAQAPEWLYFRYLLIAAGVVAGALLVWQLTELLLLIFGAILVAVLIRALSDLIHDHTPIGEIASLAGAGLIIAALLGGFMIVLGTQIQAQMADLVGRIPELLRALEDWFGIRNAEEWLAERAQALAENGGVASSIAGYSSWLIEIVAKVLLVLVAGIYLAIRPQFYLRGLLMLFPRGSRESAEDTANAVGRALKLWLVGQLAAMLMVGTLTTLGLWYLGIPSALALGLIAGLMEFVPYIGPLLSAAPAIGLGLAESPVTALWVAGLYLAIQQIEGILITPLIQQRAVDLPPAMTIFAIVAFGVLFGPVGVLFATPLAVVVFILVKKLWVRDTLDEETDVPGEPEESSKRG